MRGYQREYELRMGLFFVPGLLLFFFLVMFAFKFWPLLLFFFFVLPAIRNGGRSWGRGWHGGEWKSGGWGWGRCDTDEDAEKRKREVTILDDPAHDDEKPKRDRRYIRTADGEYLEVV